MYDPHFEAFQRAQELGLNITIHAGEVGDSAFVCKAVNEYGATRIGHGYRIARDLDVMEKMRLKNIHFEACPTSSVETGGWNYGKEDDINCCVDNIPNEYVYNKCRDNENMHSDQDECRGIG